MLLHSKLAHTLLMPTAQLFLGGLEAAFHEHVMCIYEMAFADMFLRLP